MKINFQSAYNTSQTGFCATKTILKKSAAKNLSGLASDVLQFQNIRNTALKLIETPIKNDREFSDIFQEIMHDISYDGEYVWFTEKDFLKYKNVDKKFKGLIPYCGYGPGFKYINMFLSGRLTPENTEIYKQYFPIRINSIIDVIRALEYSLQNLDKKYGKYKGITYRQGYMSEIPNQYISATTNSVISASFNSNNIIFCPERGYSVIRVKNGHKINEFQREIGSVFAEKEEEILLSFKTNYKKISPDKMDGELTKAQENMASNLFIGANKLINGTLHELNGYTKEKLLKMVNVYEEI